MRVRRGDISMTEIGRLARETGEPIEITNDEDRVVAVVSTPGPLPPEPIDKVRALLAKSPKLKAAHMRRADSMTVLETAQLLALVEAITEAAHGDG
jgi:hypothetical protein